MKRVNLAGAMVATGVSMIGSRMTLVAIPWLVLETTGSPSKMGLVAAAEMVPYVLVSVLGGALMDRVGLRRTAIASDLASVVAVAAIALGHQLGFDILIVLVAIAGGLRGLSDNSRRVMVPLLAKASGASMARITAIMDGTNRLTMMLGAATAGVLIAWTDTTTVLLIDAGTFAVAAAIVAVSAPRDFVGAPTKRREPYFKAVWAGFLHVWSDRLAFGMLAIIFAINVCNQASAVVFIPLWAAKVVGSATAVGLVIGALGLGAVVGNVVFTILATRVDRHVTLAIAFLVGGAPRFLVLALSEHLATVLVVTFVSGVAVSAINPILGVSFLDRTPDEMWPRVQGLMVAIAMAGLPLGALLGGWSAQALGLGPALLLTSALYFAVALVPVLGYRSWRSINRAPEGANPPR